MSAPDLHILPGMRERVGEIRRERGDESLMLRITVEGGGCSGYFYAFEWTARIAEDDRVFESCVVTDPVSLPLLAGANIDFVRDIMGEHIRIDNPNASSGCGCGTSFSI